MRTTGANAEAARRGGLLHFTTAQLPYCDCARRVFWACCPICRVGALHPPMPFFSRENGGCRAPTLHELGNRPFRPAAQGAVQSFSYVLIRLTPRPAGLRGGPSPKGQGAGTQKRTADPQGAGRCGISYIGLPGLLLRTPPGKHRANAHAQEGQRGRLGQNLCRLVYAYVLGNRPRGCGPDGCRSRVGAPSHLRPRI